MVVFVMSNKNTFSNCTPEEHAAHVARLTAYHKKLREGQKTEPPKRQEPDLTPEVERLGITIKMAKCWASALLKWRAAGYPTRTQEEVDRIVAICVKCKHYVKGRCKLCGCCVSHSKIPIVNKARLFTEACMENKW